MSILIKGVDMPETCAGCPMNYDECWCTVIDGDESSLFNAYDKRLDKCPLIEPPSHGRLIDADTLMAQILNEMRRYNYDETRILTLASIMKMVDELPTIIEAEGVKE